MRQLLRHSCLTDRSKYIRCWLTHWKWRKRPSFNMATARFEVGLRVRFVSRGKLAWLTWKYFCHSVVVIYNKPESKKTIGLGDSDFLEIIGINLGVRQGWSKLRTYMTFMKTKFWENGRQKTLRETLWNICPKHFLVQTIRSFCRKQREVYRCRFFKVLVSSSTRRYLLQKTRWWVCRKTTSHDYCKVCFSRNMRGDKWIIKTECKEIPPYRNIWWTVSNICYWSARCTVASVVSFLSINIRV